MKEMMSDCFRFTSVECGTLERRLHVVLNELNGPDYRDDEEAQRTNAFTIHTAVENLRRGCATNDTPADMLRQVYDSAYAGYRNCLKLGGTERDARRRAVMCAQMELEKALHFAPETDYMMSIDENCLEDLSRLWLGRKGRA